MCRGPRSGSMTLRSLLGAHRRHFGDRSAPLRPLRRPFRSVLGRFGPNLWRYWRARRRKRKMAVSQAGRPESRFQGHLSRVQPPRFWWFPTLRTAQTRAQEPVPGRASGGRPPQPPTQPASRRSAAQDPPNGQFWAQTWSKMGFPTNNTTPFAKVYGAYLGRFGPVLRVKGWS